MSVPKEWKYSAFEKQLYFYETLGSRPYDEIEKSNIFLLKKNVGFATCGKPSELPAFSNCYTGYSKEELQDIKSICAKIIEKSDQDPIQFACVKLIVYHKGASSEYPVFRITTKSGNLFIDPNARVYETWENFIKDNKLPKCEYCYPLDGEYNVERGLLVSFTFSPASGLINKTADYLDTAGSMVSLASASLFATGLFITVAPVVATVAGATAVCTGVYSVSRSLNSLYDRNKHAQSIGLGERESRSAWMSIGSTAVSVTAVTALETAQHIVDSGHSLTKLGAIGLHALNASAFAFSGFGFVDSFSSYVEKYKKGVLTRLDVFNLSCELLFLFNAIASARASTKLVNTMYNAAQRHPNVSPTLKVKMTKSQKRNLKRKAARRRAKSEGDSTSEESKDAYIVPVDGTVTPLQALIFEAVTNFVPRIEDITFTCQSISHDIICWKKKEILEDTLFSNLNKNLICLYNRYLIDAAETNRKVENYLQSSNQEKLVSKMYLLFKNSSYENSFAFCIKVVNTQDKVDAMLNEAERDIIDIKNRLEIESCETIPEGEVEANNSYSFDSISEESDYNDDIDLNPETQKLLARCADVLETLEPTCSTIESLGNILEAVKYVVIDEFKARMSIYKISLETTKSTLGSSFDIESFHKAINITHHIDVVSQMFNKTLEDLTSKGTLKKLKSKYKDVKFNMDPRTTALWDGITDGSFHFNVNHKTERLTTPYLFSIVSSIVGSAVTNKNSKLVESESVAIIKVKDKTVTYVVCWGNTERKTSSGIILVVKPNS